MFGGGWANYTSHASSAPPSLYTLRFKVTLICLCSLTHDTSFPGRKCFARHIQILFIINIILFDRGGINKLLTAVTMKQFA